MAKKRLNKKVALVGSVILAVLIGAGVWYLIPRFFGGPEPHIEAGDAAVAAAEQATDDAVRQEQYETAKLKYREAASRAKTDAVRIDVLFKLADVSIKTDEWRDAVSWWNGIVQIDPKNVKARFARLKYVYVLADSGVVAAWQQVASQASEFIELAQDHTELLAQEIAKWDVPFGIDEKRHHLVIARHLGPYLYLARGRANAEIAKLGEVTDPEKLLDGAVDDLQKVQELDPRNIYAYKFLAEAVKTRGEIRASRGNFEGRDEAATQAIELLQQAVASSPDDPEAHVNLLTEKLLQAGAAEQRREQIRLLEEDCLSLVKKFPSSAQAHFALARFYQMDLKNLDKAIDAAQSAVDLDPNSADYAMEATHLQYRKFSIYGDKRGLEKAVELAANALTLPDAREGTGPRQWANRANRKTLWTFLADCYIEQLIHRPAAWTESQRRQVMADAESAVHEIEQLVGSGEDPEVIMWRGMLELGKGDKDAAVRKLHKAYDLLKVSGIEKAEVAYLRRSYAQLSYVLAGVFKETVELGVVREFLESALRTHIEWTKPEAYLDYAELLLRFRAYEAALSVINSFEERYWANERTQTLRIKTYIGANQFTEAEEELAKLKSNDPNAIKLNLALVGAKIEQNRRAILQRQIDDSTPTIFRDPNSPQTQSAESQRSLEPIKEELKRYWAEYAGLLEELLQVDPNSVQEAYVVAFCDNSIAQGQFRQARTIVDSFLKSFPDNPSVLYYRHVLSEPEPDKVLPQRQEEIREQVLSNIVDPIERAVNLGMFCRQRNEPNKAAAEFEKVFSSTVARDQHREKAKTGYAVSSTYYQVAADYLFGAALREQDWKRAEEIAQAARQENLDRCQGQFFAARLAFARGQYKEALARIDECLTQRPVFSLALLLRSNINAALGQNAAAIEDAQEARYMNPLDGTIAKALALALYRRNQQLGETATTEQVLEVKSALNQARALNPGDLELLSFYAEYISSTEPLQALAILQVLQKSAPSMTNALLLGRLATKVALEETDPQRKQALLAVADSSFRQAQTYDPNSRLVLGGLAEHYRLIGQPEKAEQLIKQSQDEALLWRHYLQAGQTDDAKALLERLHKRTPTDTDVLKGLLLVAEMVADADAAKQYSERLLSLEDNAENRLFQIRTFLQLGLVEEAGRKLESFNEKHSEDKRGLFLEAWLALRRGQLRRALDLANRHLQNNQSDAVAWRLRGQINRLMGNNDQAIADLIGSKSLSDEPRTRIALAQAFWQAGQSRDAIMELESTIDLPEAPVQARALLEQIYLQLDRTDALRKLYEKTLQKFPDSIFWLVRAGTFAVKQKQFDRAEQLYLRAWQQSNKVGQPNMWVLDGYLQSLVLAAGTPNTPAWNPSKLDKVFAEGSKHVNGDLAAVAYFRMAEAKLKLGDETTATEYCRNALDRAGTNEFVAFEIMNRMQSLLGAQAVTRYCEEKLKANPDSLAANLNMFNLGKLNGQYNKAVQHIDKCLKIIGPGSERRIDYVMRKAEVLTLAYSRTSDKTYLEKAVAEYESLLAEVPNDTRVLNNLAYMLAENNERLDEAVVLAKRAVDAKPNHPGFLDTYAFVCYKNGRNLEAHDAIQAAVQQYESQQLQVPAEVYEHLGLIKEQSGRDAEALAAYRQALQIGSDKVSAALKERIDSAIERLSQKTRGQR